MEMLAVVSAVTEVKVERLTLTGSRRYGQFIGNREPMAYDGRDVDVVIEWVGTPTEFDARVTSSFVGASLVTNYVHYAPDRQQVIVDPDGHPWPWKLSGRMMTLVCRLSALTGLSMGTL